MLESLLYPESIAVIGASRNTEKVGHAFLANLISGGFKGRIIPVNPDAQEILGLQCYRNLRDYKGKVDLSMVVVPTRFVQEAVQDAIQAGSTSVIVISAGFKEVGAEGAGRERELVSLCQARGCG